jgi:glycosyltransferase involved in cell wall biosynthesis
MRPIAIPTHIKKNLLLLAALKSELPAIRQRFEQLLKGPPKISIVIPAYNEEKNILQTLSSLSHTVSNQSVEIIVVNNNSTDDTAQLAEAAGVRCLHETTQGITPSRNAGLAAALGQYIINADADTIYPPCWVTEMVTPLLNQTIALSYGRFSFIPVGKTPRLTYFFYEYGADLLRYFNKYCREEAVNVYGFNSAFRKADALQVEGFNHPAHANEDGWLALKLRKEGFGKLHYVTHRSALVFTTDRRLQADGGFWKALKKRVKRVVRF